MVAKISHGASLYGALAYNLRKVGAATARILGGNRIFADTTGTGAGELQRTLRSFDPYLWANRNTEKPILHISLNPAPDDNLTDGQFEALAHDYMRKMGYGDQPYAVYLHEDTGRRHIHIVSTCVDDMGRKLDDSYEWRRSMQACRELEVQYGLRRVADKRQELTDAYLRKADYTRGDVKRQIANILHSVRSAYRYRTFGEFNALLSCFNVSARQVRGEFGGKAYLGVVYSLLDARGEPVGPPVKSSRLGADFGAEGLARRMTLNARGSQAGKLRPALRDAVRLAVHACGGCEEKFRRLLGCGGVDAVFRRTAGGRIYGVTFVDHRTRDVVNGSLLGRDCSANAFERLFCAPEPAPLLPPGDPLPIPSVTEPVSFVETLPGPEALRGEDWTEQAFARRLRRKRRKRRPKL